MKGLIGRKLGMTQMYTERGEVVPVTLIEAGPCHVVQVKTVGKDGYRAVQVGFGVVAERKLSQGERGHLRKGSAPTLRYLREFRVGADESYEPGQVLDVSLFENGDKVDVTGTSKGKGFAGGVKRHHFAGGPKTHGASDRTRAPGSVGATTTPGRVLKGMRMAGHLGDARATVSGIEVVLVDRDRHIIGVRGGVPGATNALVVIKQARKQ